jgi:hypothetical protein
VIQEDQEKGVKKSPDMDSASVSGEKEGTPPLLQAYVPPKEKKKQKRTTMATWGKSIGEEKRDKAGVAVTAEEATSAKEGRLEQ